MAVFGPEYYKGSNPTPNGVDQYRVALRAALQTAVDKEAFLKDEAIAITRTVTDGVRYVIQKERHVRRLVLETGSPPLASWAAALDQRSTYSLDSLKRKIE